MKQFKLQGDNTVKEITIDLAGLKTMKSKLLDGKSEKMILKRNPETKTMERHISSKSERQIKAEEKKLNAEGIETLVVRKQITPNEYDGMFLIEKPDGDVTFEIGLDGTLKEVNKMYKKELHLRKQRCRKETVGYIAFGYNEKTNKYVCTKMYKTESAAETFITKRYGVIENTIKVYKVVKYYKGFEFKHQDLDDCNRIRDAKAKLGEM